MTFISRQVVRFAHVDAAGIVFYPRYFEMLNAAVEDYFAIVVGVDFATIHCKRGLGVPTVKLDAEFKAPSRLGEALDFAMSIRRVGRSSADVSVDVYCAAELRLHARLVLVCVDMGTGRALAWPEDMRPSEAAQIAA